MVINVPARKKFKSRYTIESTYQAWSEWFNTASMVTRNQRAFITITAKRKTSGGGGGGAVVVVWWWCWMYYLVEVTAAIYTLHCAFPAALPKGNRAANTSHDTAALTWICLTLSASLHTLANKLVPLNPRTRLMNAAWETHYTRQMRFGMKDRQTTQHGTEICVNDGFTALLEIKGTNTALPPHTY